MSSRGYRSMDSIFTVPRRDFLKISAVAGAGIVLGTPRVWSQEQDKQEPPAKPATNIEEILKIPRTATSLPGPLPGRVVEVRDPGATVDDQAVPAVVSAMFARGLEQLTGKDAQGSFDLLFTPADVVGIKVNPVGGGMISTHHEVVQAIIDWLEQGGLPRGNIVIFDRFDSMLASAGFDAEHYPGVRIEALQTIDESVWGQEEPDTQGFLDEDGVHLSHARFDGDVYYFADVEGPKDLNYLNQHVENGKLSRFGKLLTQELTKFINVPVFKNTGNGISMATKNVGYGVIDNTGRLHKPLFFDVCTEVLAFPCVRDKMVLNVNDGLIGQYDGGPMPNAQFMYPHNTLYLATDPIALDTICHHQMVEKRKAEGVEVNEHPRYTEYLRYAESIGLGVGTPDRIDHVRVVG
jgi:hypothetical protein